MVIHQHFIYKHVLVYLVHAYLKEHSSNGISHPDKDVKHDLLPDKWATMLIHVKRLAEALSTELANGKKSTSQLSVKELLQHLEELKIDLRLVREFLKVQVEIDAKANEVPDIESADLASIQRMGMLLHVRLFMQELDLMIAEM